MRPEINLFLIVNEKEFYIQQLETLNTEILKDEFQLRAK
jgi:hypothetical protein